MNWVMQCFKKYVVFSGRVRRREYLFTIRDSEKGSNRYGDNPKGVA